MTRQAEQPLSGGPDYPDVVGLGAPSPWRSTQSARRAAAWTRLLRHWPVVVPSLALLLLQFTLGAPQLAQLEFDRAAIGAGELWRLVTAHGVHADASHALQNALALAGLLAFARAPKHLLRVLLIAMPLLGLALWWLVPALQGMRGASGLLFVGLVWLLLLPHQCRWPIAPLWRNALWLVLACKLAADFMALLGVFPRAAGPDWVVAGEAHLLGAFIGWQLALADRARDRGSHSG